MSKIFLVILSALFFSLSYAQKIPIIGYIGIPADNASVHNYLMMKDAGFTVSLSTFPNMDDALKSLTYAEEAGMKLILFFPQIHTDSKNTIDKLKSKKAFLGYFIGDEPTPKDFPDFRKYVDIIKQYDDKHLFYINLHPIYAPKTYLQGLTYSDYISQANINLSLEFLSFDHYPIVEDSIRNSFYENLEIIRKESRSSNKEFWGFANSTIHHNYLQPTVSGIKLQHFSNLLYGAQSLQYFTYWTLTSDPQWKKDNFSYAIVDNKGNPTPTYNVIKTVNEQIQRLAWVFSRAKSEATFHTGNEIPPGTNKLNSIPDGFKFFSTYGKNALVSLMSNKKKKFIIVQNKSLKENMKLEYQLSKPMKVVNNKTGKVDVISVSKRYITNVLPGDIIIFTYGN